MKKILLIQLAIFATFGLLAAFFINLKAASNTQSEFDLKVERNTAIFDVLDGTAALQEGRDNDIDRENLQIFLTAGVLAVLVAIALILLLRKNSK